jgi:hypothetical protein
MASIKRTTRKKTERKGPYPKGYYQGFFTPTHPEKYRGDVKNIVFRSGWELRVMRWLDNNSSILAWSSEEIVIPYKSPLDDPKEMKVRRYFPDFFVEAIGNDGKVKKILIEVKPVAQTKQPTTTKRKTKRYLTEVMTWEQNQAKWQAATKYCEAKGWTFRIMTEHDIFGDKLPK